MGLALDFVHPFQAMRQWWEMKAKHFDTVLFFKVSTDGVWRCVLAAVMLHSFPFGDCS